MSDSIADVFLSLIDVSPIARVRRNHGLEHATLHVLSEQHPGQPMAGHSDWGGFWILGDLTTEQVTAGVYEALLRLQNGQRHLAVHPNCGTNLVAAGILGGGLASLAWLGVGRKWQDKLERLPLAFTLATLAMVAAQPLGLLLQQEVTTSGDPQGLAIVEIIPSQRGRLKAHRILTTS
ncbi:MAG: hypothetical protein JXB15_08090 [Anaerolineales bacterium]|nr:hypothetical protein [Anaerolineales bacterium]